MSETDTFVSQEYAILERAKWLLRRLAYEYESGTVTDDRCIHCIYCSWQDEDYRAEPEHDADCPIEQTREFLWAEDNPYASEALLRRG